MKLKKCKFSEIDFKKLILNKKLQNKMSNIKKKSLKFGN